MLKKSKIWKNTEKSEKYYISRYTSMLQKSQNIEKVEECCKIFLKKSTIFQNDEKAKNVCKQFL